MEDGRTKLVVDLPDDATYSAETLWVTGEAGRPGLFRVDNVPVLAFGLALDDIVRAERQDDDRWHFLEVVTPSGLWTVRVLGTSDADATRFEGIVNLLKPVSIASEKHNDRYIAYAMKPEDFKNVERAVDELEQPDILMVEIANE